MKSLAMTVGLMTLAAAPLAMPASSRAQTQTQTPSATPSKPPAKAPAQTPPKAQAAPKPAAKAPAQQPAKTPPAAPVQVKPSLAELRRDVEAKKAEVARLQETPLPGDDAIRKHREARATLEETLTQHESRIQQSEPKLPGWRKERSDLKAMPRASRQQTARIQELDIVIAEAERIVAEARGDAAAVKTKIRDVDGEIAKVESRRAGVRREQEASERRLRQAEDALAIEEKRAKAYLALYDVTLRARAFDTTMKTPKPPFEQVKYDETTAAKLADQVAQEQTSVENGRYTYDPNGIKRQLQADGAKFFQTAKQAANKKPISTPAAKARPVRTKTVNDIDALQKAWAQALGNPGLPEAHDLAPLIDRVQTALWAMK